MDSGEVLFSPSSVSANQVFVVIKCFSMLVDSRYHVVNSAFYCGVKQGFTSFNAKLSWSFWILTRSCREWTGRSWQWSTWRRWGSTRRRMPGGRRTSGRWCWASWWARAASASAWTGRNRHLENSGTLEHCQNMKSGCPTTQGSLFALINSWRRHQ